MWTVNEAPPYAPRNQLITAVTDLTATAAATAIAEAAVAETISYDQWRHHLCLIRAALAPFPLALAAVLDALEHDRVAPQNGIE